MFGSLCAARHCCGLCHDKKQLQFTEFLHHDCAAAAGRSDGHHVGERESWRRRRRCRCVQPGSVPFCARKRAGDRGNLFAMTLGLATGMGYLGLAALFFFIFAASMLLLSALKFGKGDEAERVLKITIPETSTMKACSLTCSASICLPARLSRSKPPTWGHSMNCSTASYFGRHRRLWRFRRTALPQRKSQHFLFADVRKRDALTLAVCGKRLYNQNKREGAAVCGCCLQRMKRIWLRRSVCF